MLKYFIVLGLLLTGCIHVYKDSDDIDYQMKILEKRIKLLELDIQYLLDDDDCIMENTDYNEPI